MQLSFSETFDGQVIISIGFRIEHYVLLCACIGSNPGSEKFNFSSLQSVHWLGVDLLWDLLSSYNMPTPTIS